MNDDLIYFDNNATTQPLPEVVGAMVDRLVSRYANPSSLHQFGQAARHDVEQARAAVARLVGASAREIVFTASGTESINMAIRGSLVLRAGRRNIVTTAVEHSAVARTLDDLTGEGYEVRRVAVDTEGCLDLDQLLRFVDEDTALITVMHANNETGVLFDIAPIAALAEEAGVPLHVDAVQSAGKVPIDVSRVPVHLLSLSAHKFHGPKGVGALYVRRGTRLHPIITGGHQERDLRAGTEAVPQIVGMGVAAEAAMKRLSAGVGKVATLRDCLEAGILKAVPDAVVFGRSAPRICNTTNIGFANVAAEAMLILLSQEGICASSGAACSSGAIEPSPVLKAMKADDRYLHGAIRFSLSHLNTPDEVDRVVECIPRIVARLSSVLSR